MMHILNVSVPLPVQVAAGSIPVVATAAVAQAAVAAGRKYVNQRTSGLTQAPNLNKRARTALLGQLDRDVTTGVSHATTIDGAGNPIHIKQEMKLDGENAYEHAAAAAAAAVATNSLHPGAFPAHSHTPGQPTTVAAFNAYYEAGANAGEQHTFLAMAY